MGDHRLDAGGNVIDRDILNRIRGAVCAHGVFRVYDLAPIGWEVGQEFHFAVVRELAKAGAVQVHHRNLEDLTGTRHRRIGLSTDRVHEDDLFQGQRARAESDL